MPNLTQRLLYVARQCYAINDDGSVGAAENSTDIEWTVPPVAFLGGVDNIDRGLVGEITEGIVVGFRGTLPPDDPERLEVLLDWLNDFDALLVDDKHGFGGKVHNGFMGARDTIWAGMAAAIANRVSVSPTKPIYITGHSKGGAVANLAAARLHIERPGSEIIVCTFAAARPGDPDFAAQYNAAITRSTRYEYTDDIVPHVPPSDDFVHLMKFTAAVDDAIGHLNAGFSSVGTLQFIDWSNLLESPVPGSAAATLLQLKRFTSLTELMMKLDANRIAGDHGIAGGSGYAGAPYPVAS